MKEETFGRHKVSIFDVYRMKEYADYVMKDNIGCKYDRISDEIKE